MLHPVPSGVEGLRQDKSARDRHSVQERAFAVDCRTCHGMVLIPRVRTWRLRGSCHFVLQVGLVAWLLIFSIGGEKYDKAKDGSKLSMLSRLIACRGLFYSGSHALGSG